MGKGRSLVDNTSPIWDLGTVTLRPQGGSVNASRMWDIGRVRGERGPLVVLYNASRGGDVGTPEGEAFLLSYLILF